MMEVLCMLDLHRLKPHSILHLLDWWKNNRTGCSHDTQQAKLLRLTPFRSTQKRLETSTDAHREHRADAPPSDDKLLVPPGSPSQAGRQLPWAVCLRTIVL